MPRAASDLSQLLDALEDVYGVQKPIWPTDPYRSLVWWHCGRPPGDAACAKGWESLNREIGVAPDQLLSAGRAKIALVLKSGGMAPELRAMRLQEITERVVREFAGELVSGLNGLPLAQALPYIAPAGAWYLRANGNPANLPNPRLLRQDEKRYTFKIDHSVSAMNRLTFRYTDTPIVKTQKTPNSPTTDTGDYKFAKQYKLAGTHTFSPTIVNDVRVNVTPGNFSSTKTP